MPTNKPVSDAFVDRMGITAETDGMSPIAGRLFARLVLADAPLSLDELAEELGVSSQTIEESLKSPKPEVRRLLGSDGNFGEQMGLTKDWAARVIRLVGNYAETYDRNVGIKSKLGIPRGINQLWTNGGILYAPPVR